MMRKKLLIPLLLFCCIEAMGQGHPSYVPDNGLVGWWPFNNNALDLSGKGNHGTGTNVTAVSDRFGVSNAAYHFNGINSRIDVPDAQSLRVRKITMSVWVRSDSNIMRQIIYKGSMYANGEAYSLNSGGSAVKVNSGCATALGWQGGNYRDSFSTNSWTHLAVTYDGDTFRLYKNAVQDTAYAFSGLVDSCVGGELRFGFNHLRWFVSTGDPYYGDIDDIGVWNRALSPQEISGLFTGAVTDCGYGMLGINVCEAKRNLHIKDVLRLEPRNSPPDNPGEGDIYYDATLHKLRVYDGTAWQSCW